MKTFALVSPSESDEGDEEVPVRNPEASPKAKTKSSKSKGLAQPKASAADPDQITPPPLPPPVKPPGDAALADSERQSSEEDGLAKHQRLVKGAQGIAFSRECSMSDMPAQSYVPPSGCG